MCLHLCVVIVKTCVTTGISTGRFKIVFSVDSRSYLCVLFAVLQVVAGQMLDFLPHSLALIIFQAATRGSKKLVAH